MAFVVSVQVGRSAPLGPRSVSSGFVKKPVSELVEVSLLNLAGDEQADLTVHGGPDKAVYLYAGEHYPQWAIEFPNHHQLLQPGGFGENITTSGLTEQTVCIGDVLVIGSVQLQVAQPRQPCFKLGLRFADNAMGRAMMKTGRSGWYARVLQTGSIQAGDEITILRRPNPTWTISRFNSLILNRSATSEEQKELLGIEGLAKVWQDGIRESLAEELKML